MKQLLLLFFLFPVLLYAQKRDAALIDSLLKELPGQKEDTNKVMLLNNLSHNYYSIYPDAGKKYGHDALELAKKLGWEKGMAMANNSIGANYWSQSDYAKELGYYFRALKIYEEIYDRNGIAMVTGNIGNVYYKQSDYPKALAYYFKALKIYEESGNAYNEKAALILNRVVNSYSRQNNFKESGRYYIKQLKIQKISEEINFYNGILFGIFIFVISYNLFLFYATKDKSLKYLIFSVAAYFFNFIISEAIRNNRIEDYVLYFGFQFTVFILSKYYLKFIHYFLCEYEITIFNNRLLLTNIKLLNILFSIIFFVSIMLYFSNINAEIEILNWFVICGSLVCFAVLFYPLILFFKNGLHKHKGIRFIALAQSILLVGNFISFLLSVFFSIDNVLGEFSFASFVILLSISVADKINYLKIQKAQAQEEAMALLITNEKINMLLKDQELRSVSNMLDAQESERKRIASDLHDRLGSMLSTVKLYFNSVEEQIDQLKERNKEQYIKANSLLDEACDEVRKISHDLISGELVKFGLVSALRQLVKTIEDTGQLKIKILAFGMNSRLDTSVEIALYRVIQETMNNMLRHSKATEVTIQLNKTDNGLNIVVEDNGIGFDVDAAKLKGGIGLKSMETRVKKLNGKIYFDSGKGRGTTIIIDIPG